MLEGIEAKVATRALEGDPATEILSYAHEHKGDLIVIGSRGWGEVNSLHLKAYEHQLTFAFDLQHDRIARLQCVYGSA